MLTNLEPANALDAIFSYHIIVKIGRSNSPWNREITLNQDHTTNYGNIKFALLCYSPDYDEGEIHNWLSQYRYIYGDCKELYEIPSLLIKKLIDERGFISAYNMTGGETLTAADLIIKYGRSFLKKITKRYMPIYEDE